MSDVCSADAVAAAAVGGLQRRRLRVSLIKASGTLEQLHQRTVVTLESLSNRGIRWRSVKTVCSVQFAPRYQPVYRGKKDRVKSACMV